MPMVTVMILCNIYTLPALDFWVPGTFKEWACLHQSIHQHRDALLMVRLGGRVPETGNRVRERKRNDRHVRRFENN